MRIFIFFLLYLSFAITLNAVAQIRIIDNKGTLKNVDTSKWTVSGLNIFNKNLGNIGIGTNLPQAKLHVNGQLRLQGLSLSTSNVDVLTTDANGDVYRRTLSNLLSTITVNNSSSTNSLSTTVNGVTGTSVNIINSNSLAGIGSKLTSTVNGVAADLTPSSGTIAASKLLGFDASGNLVLGADPTATSVSNSSSANSLSTTVNGITGTTVNIINSNALAGASNKLTSTVNGVAADLTPSAGTIAASKLLGFDASGNLVLGADPTATSVSNSSSTNSLSTTVNGITGTTVNIINSNALAGASNKLTSTVNGVAADLTPSAGTIAASKLLGFNSTGNLVLGADPTATSVSNSSSANSLSTTVNGITGTTVNIINSNALAGASNKLTSTVNGVAADLTPSAGTIVNNLGFNASGSLVLQAATGSTIGDIKTGIQPADHSGWIKLDGRAKSTLTATQQTAATSLGIGANLPDAGNAYLVQNGTALGSVSGTNSKTIAQNQLPNINLNWSHNHTFNTSNVTNALSFSGGTAWYDGFQGQIKTVSTTNLNTAMNNSGSTWFLNGNVTQQPLDVTPRSLSVNMFIYLGN